jgi:hypothetical protein
MRCCGTETDLTTTASRSLGSALTRRTSLKVGSRTLAPACISFGISIGQSADNVGRCHGEQPQNATGPIPYRLFWLVVDPSLHVLASFPISNADDSNETVFSVLDSCQTQRTLLGSKFRRRF